MGEVYLAHDPKLNRPVALKLLRESLNMDREHLRRFEQEASAISSLNHPNILTIHEVGRDGAVNFIVTEFVEGLTLRRIIEGEERTLGELLNIAVQIAAGLAAAHNAAIVHRDLKPENIVVRYDGYVKILDFGLVKLIGEADAPADAAGDSTVSDVQTNSGEVLGTVRYMSPEQLRGAAVDRRSDLWSLGVVCYEMVTGHAPFPGDSAAVVIAGILEHEPTPVAAHAPSCPPGLRRIIAKALTKERERRYQTAGELLTDLRAFLDEPKNRAALGRPVVAAREARPPVGDSSGGRGVAEVFDRLLTSTATSTGSIIDGITRWGRPPHPLLLALLLCAVAYAIAWAGSAAPAVMFATGSTILLLLFHWGRGGAQSRPFHAIKLERLTGTGKVVDAVISPDGKYVAYISEGGGRQSLWVRQAATSSNVQLVAPIEAVFHGITFSPDSDFVNYVFSDSASEGLWLLYQVPTLGGRPKRLATEVHTPVTFSPDGRRVAFVRGYPSEKVTVLMVADADGTNERRLVARRTPDEFGWRGGPSWSPSGDYIASAAGVYDVDMGLSAVRVRDGVERPLTQQRWPWIGRIAWLGNRKGLVLAARDPQTGLSQLWHVSYPKGDVRRITNDLNDYNSRSVSLSADSKTLVSVQSDHLSGIWIVPDGDASRARQITDGRSDGLGGLAWARDNRIVYTSNASGRQDIWSAGQDGSAPVQLTTEGGMNYHPAVSPDCRHIAFVSTRGGEPDIWLTNMNGDNAVRLTSGGNPSWPNFTPDGRWIVYKSQRSGKRTLWRVPVEGGESVPVTNRFAGMPSVSPDGRLIACDYWDEQLASPYTIAVIPFEGGTALRTFDLPPTFAHSVYLSGMLRWTNDGSAISYIENRDGVSNIWNQPLDGSRPEPVTSFQSEHIFWFDWSPDGQHLACARGIRISDIVVVRDVSGRGR